MVNYQKTSPYYSTTLQKGYLDFYTKRTVVAESDDFLYEIEPQYVYRPDLLAHDLYGTSKLWWVFIARNMDVLKDPVFDFTPGTQIYLPKANNLSSIIG
jgi:hypothetical protein